MGRKSLDHGFIPPKAKVFTYSNGCDRSNTVYVAAIGIKNPQWSELTHLGDCRHNCGYNSNIYTLADLQALINDR
jgi:hypothetical protein